MSWFQGAVATEPAGHDSAKKQGVAVTCDVCKLATEFFSQAVVAKAGAEGLHRLLLNRGWTFDLSTGEDACSGCTLAVAS